MLSSTFYEKLDPSYYEQIQLLEKNLNTVKNEKEAMEVLQEFSTCYMMPWQLWERYLRVALDVRFYKDNLKHNNFHLPIYQFFYSQKNHFFIRISQKSFKRKMLSTNLQNILKEFNGSVSNKASGLIKDVSILAENLAFPHNHLTEIWHIYEKSLCWSPTKKMEQNYQKMIDLYTKIMSAENDEEKWIEALAETNDKEFVEHVVEFKLGGDLTNKNLWHVYVNYLKSRISYAKIDYWKEQYTKKLMHTCSKYCHFFLDDETMLEEYQTAAQIHGTISVPWMNIYPFETYDKYSIIDQVRSRTFIYHQPHVDPLTSSFTTENMISQKFPFKGPLIYYIQKNANANLIQKLKMSCKYFHIRDPIFICYKLRYIAHAANEINRVKYHRQSVEIRSTVLFYPDEDLYITTAIEFSADNRDDLSSFISRIFKCEAKFVSIFYQDLTVEEFKFLTNNVIDLSLHNVRIFVKGEVLFLEEMLELVPNVQYLYVRSIVTNSQTFQKLCNINFKNELHTWKFDFTDINEFNPRECAEFVIKNACSRFSLNIEFRFVDHLQWMNGRQIVSNYENIVNQIDKEQSKKDEMPSFKLTSRF